MATFVVCRLSLVVCLVYLVFCLLSLVSCLLSLVSCLLSLVFCLLSFVFCLLSFVFCLLSFVFCLWSLVFGLLSLVFGLWSLVLGPWSLVFCLFLRFCIFFLKFSFSVSFSFSSAQNLICFWPQLPDDFQEKLLRKFNFLNRLGKDPLKLSFPFFLFFFFNLIFLSFFFFFLSFFFSFFSSFKNFFFFSISFFSKTCAIGCCWIHCAVGTKVSSVVFAFPCLQSLAPAMPVHLTLLATIVQRVVGRGGRRGEEGRRGFALESAGTRICRETDARVSTNVYVRDGLSCPQCSRCTTFGDHR